MHGSTVFEKRGRQYLNLWSTWWLCTTWSEDIEVAMELISILYTLILLSMHLSLLCKYDSLNKKWIEKGVNIAPTRDGRNDSDQCPWSGQYRGQAVGAVGHSKTQPPFVILHNTGGQLRPERLLPNLWLIVAVGKSV
jgi:hypothetical protein